MICQQGLLRLKARTRGAVIGVCITFYISMMTPGAAVAGVFRCPDGEGGVIFQQVPCLHGEAIELDIRTTEWITGPAGKRLHGERRSAGSGSRDQAALARAARARQKQEQACWKASQRIERIEAELRHGYKPSRGERLRRQRREQSDYLREFCR